MISRGEIRWVTFDPVLGSEASKRRPAVVVSNDQANAAAFALGRGVITVVPITSNVSRLHPFQVLLTAETTGLPKMSKAQAEQVRAVAVERIGPEVIGRLRADDQDQLDRALRLHLDL